MGCPEVLTCQKFMYVGGASNEKFVLNCELQSDFREESMADKRIEVSHKG